MNHARMACTAAGCLFAFCAAAPAHAQMQGFGHGVAVNMEAAPAPGSGALQMPGEAAPGSTFYGLGAAPNAQRLPTPFGQAAPADMPASTAAPAMTAPAAEQIPFQVVEESPAPAAAVMEPAPAGVVASAPMPPAPEPEPALTPAPAPKPSVQAAIPEPEPALTPVPMPEIMPAPEPMPAAAPAVELKAPEPAPKKASADIPPAPKPKAAPAPKPAAVETAAATPNPEPKPGVTRLTFGVTDSKLGDSSLNKLRTVGEGLLADEKTRLEIRAYAGGDGMSENRARRLSLARALAVRSELIEQGVRSNRIDVRALGDKTDEKPFNRVDLTLSSSGG